VCRDGGIVIDEQVQTSSPGVFAAGDVCCAKALEQASAHWFQMRLWTQVVAAACCCCKAYHVAARIELVLCLLSTLVRSSDQC
jgi:thioredoxin reductase